MVERFENTFFLYILSVSLLSSAAGEPFDHVGVILGDSPEMWMVTVD